MVFNKKKVHNLSKIPTYTSIKQIIDVSRHQGEDPPIDRLGPLIKIILHSFRPIEAIHHKGLTEDAVSPLRKGAGHLITTVLTPLNGTAGLDSPLLEAQISQRSRKGSIQNTW